MTGMTRRGVPGRRAAFFSQARPVLAVTKFQSLKLLSTLWLFNIAMENHHFNGKIHYKL